MYFARIISIILLLVFGLSLEAQISVRANIQEEFTDSTSRFYRSATFNFPVLDSLYKENNFRPIFTRGMAEMYLQYLRETEKLGFNLSKYDYYFLDSLHHAQHPEAVAKFDFLAADSYLLLMEDITNGLLKSENTRGYKVHFPLAKLDAYTELKNISEIPSLNYLKLAEPQILSYQKTKEKLLSYVDFEESFGEPLIWEDSIFLGDRDSLVIPLKKRLFLLGDYTREHRMKSKIYDKDLVHAIKMFQTRNLLDSTGILDKKTIDALNIPIKDQIVELQLNLERWRWLPNYLGNYFAFANLPSFEMSLVRNDTLLLRQKMVCGKVSRSTPSFFSTMSYLDINPTWTVPPTILQKDVLPAIKRSSSYLSKKNMKVLNVSTGKYVTAAEINWANAKSYKFIQGPGLSNSLGVVKFIFPNNYYIFFHDTPTKQHFAYKERAYSSGCIRLSQPKELAEILLSYNTESFSLTQIDSIIETQKTNRILLEEKPMVYVHYVTHEYIDGKLFHYPDMYAYNKPQGDFFLEQGGKSK